MEAAQKDRIDELRKNLLRYTDELYADNHSMFDMHIFNLAREKLAPAHFGPIMLVTLGRVYQLQAKRSRWNMGAYFKCALRCLCFCALFVMCIHRSDNVWVSALQAAAGQDRERVQRSENRFIFWFFFVSDHVGVSAGSSGTRSGARTTS